VVIGVLRVPCCRGERPDPAEVLIAARRLAGTRPHLAAVAGLVHPKDLWQLCRNELTGAEVRIGGRAIHRHDEATPRGLGKCIPLLSPRRS
jgi:hypothetical protein